MPSRPRRRARRVPTAPAQPPGRARLYNALGFPSWFSDEQPIAWSWCSDGRAWCHPDCLPTDIQIEVVEGRADDKLGEIYPWCIDDVEPGGALSCTACAKIFYRKPPAIDGDEGDR
jgi:hypothetical protein